MQFNLKHPASRILHPASRILHPASRILHPASRILHLASCLLIPSLTMFGQGTADLQKISRATNISALHDMGIKLRAQAEVSKDQATRKAQEKHWVIRKVSEDGKTIELKGLDQKGKPIYFSTTNLNAAKTLSTNKTWSGGSLGLNLSGNGIVMRLWDAGVARPTHQELTGRITVCDGATSLADHSTHVAGTMLATGIVANAHGMGNLATLRDFDWFYDYAEMTAEAANGALLSNHSYIYLAGWYWSGASWYWYGDPAISETTDYYYGYYMDDAAIVDQIAFDAPYYLVCKAAGNDRLGGPSSQPVSHYVWVNNNWVPSNLVRDLNGGPNGWDCISSGFGVSKNIMTVGAVNPIPNGYSSPADVVFASFSGTGPTDDGRIKPDIVADGIGLYSTLSGSNTAYGSSSGTSMATPNLAGSLMVLQEHYHNLHGNYMRASTLRGLAIHTSDEAGPNPGPDYKFGWGLLNTAKAANALSQLCSTLVLEDTLTNGNTFTINLNAKGTEPLIATICWTDPAGTPPPPALNPPTLMLVNDLDMRIDGSTYQPYVLDPLNVSAAATTGDNFRDNVEKIYIQNPSAGNHTLLITHKNNLANNFQVFSLIVTGLNTNFSPGSVSSDQTICANTTPQPLHGIPPTGGILPYTYQWQKSSDLIIFNNISGATGLNYQPETLTSTTYYRQVQTSSGNCGSVITGPLTIAVVPTPLPNITGPGQVCLNSGPETYFTEPGMSNYTWTVSAGGTITSGSATNQITVLWNSAGPQTLSVNYTTPEQCTAASPGVKDVQVNPIPPAPEITALGENLSSNAPNGNQWYFEGTPLPGANLPTYQVTTTGWYWDVVTLAACSSDTSNHLYVLVTGEEELSSEKIKIYPVPNNGLFSVSVAARNGQSFSIVIYNTLAQVVYKKTGNIVNGALRQSIDLRSAPAGIYTFLLRTADGLVARKLLIAR